MDDTLADPLTGRLLDGRYAVSARIAHGGMATVYLAMDTRLDREVALKVMHAELARDEEFVRRFIGEAKSVARLSHQNVVAVFDQGSDGPFLYLAMEYVPGRTLKELLRDSGRFPPATTLEIMAGVLDGLAAAHRSGIVHRDVKPENVLVTADGRLKVADFGLARALTAAGHTRTGLLIGTVAYVPPEQVEGGATGPRGDVYSAGVMFFELLTGRQPFTGDTPLSVAYQHVNSDVPAPSLLVPGIPAVVDQLVLAATSRDPALRPPDADAFAGAVRRVISGLSEPGGLTGVLGAGVQGVGEAPWLELDTPAVTNGWWATTGTLPAVSVFDAEPGRPALPAPEPGGTDLHRGSQLGAGQFGTAQFGSGQFGTAQFGSGQANGGRGGGFSHTLVVDREEGRRHRDGHEPFLQRWLFSSRLLIVLLVVMLCAGLGLGGWYFFAGRYVRVPSVSGYSVAVAATALKNDGLTVRTGSQVHSNSVAKGLVVGTKPSGRVAKGTTVRLLTSDGPFTSVVPQVAGDTLSAAQAALQRVHLSATTQKVGSTAPVGSVVGTTPAAGTSWPQTKTVAIQVSAGPALPNFAGQNVAAAEQWAAQYQVTLQQQQDNSSQQPQGIITGQSPAANSTVQAGQTIVVNVSTGQQPISVPDVDGMSSEQATQELQSAGFNVQVNWYGPVDKVFHHNPSDQATRGSTITLAVGY
jgi:eukaryotic-like serine/threonine-protein kinase